MEKANKIKNIKVLNVNWLYECTKRWSRVAEEDFSLKGHEAQQPEREESEEEQQHQQQEEEKEISTSSNDDRPLKKTKIEPENPMDEEGLPDVDNDEEFSNLLERALEEEEQ